MLIIRFGQCFAVPFHGFAIERAHEERLRSQQKLSRTYLDGGDYVGAAAAAAGKLHLGLAELSRLSWCFTCDFEGVLELHTRCKRVILVLSSQLRSRYGYGHTNVLFKPTKAG